VALVACTSDPPCGEGTHAEAQSCVANLTPTCGTGTSLENGVCVPDQGGGAVCGQGTHAEGGECVPDLDKRGNAARLADVHLIAPAAIVGLADGPLNQSFATGESLVVLGVYAPGQAALRLFGGGATRGEDGSYRLEATGSFDAPAQLAGELFSTSPFRFAVRVFGADAPLVLLDTRVLDGELVTIDDVPQMRSGRIAGVLTEANAAAVYIESANLDLARVLEAVEAAPDVDADGDGDLDAWTFAISFVSEPVWLF
jgi:hypothetical protein